MSETKSNFAPKESNEKKPKEKRDGVAATDAALATASLQNQRSSTVSDQ